jgi:hypothetical protein
MSGNSESERTRQESHANANGYRQCEPSGSNSPCTNHALCEPRGRVRRHLQFTTITRSGWTVKFSFHCLCPRRTRDPPSLTLQGRVDTYSQNPSDGVPESTALYKRASRVSTSGLEDTEVWSLVTRYVSTVPLWVVYDLTRRISQVPVPMSGRQRPGGDISNACKGRPRGGPCHYSPWG